METWKTVGWVPDSDEEDLEFATPATAPTTTPTPSIATKRNDVEQPGKQTDTAEALDEVVQHNVERKRAEESEEDELAGPAPVWRTMKKIYKKKAWTISEPEQKQCGPRTIPNQLLSDSTEQMETTSDNERDSALQIEPPAAFGEPQNDEPDQGNSHDDRDSNPEAARRNLDYEDMMAVLRQNSEHPASDRDVATLGLASTPMDIDPSLGSPTSSPLTIASRSPDAPPTWDSPRDNQNLRFAPQVAIATSPIPTLQLDDESDQSPLDTIQSEHRSGRSLRDRRLIQLHPYREEERRYKMNMHASGVKATIVQLSSSHNSDDKSHEDDSQLFQPSLPKSPRAPRPRSARADGTVSLRVGRDPYELPDVKDILDGNDGPVPRPQKRRKLINPHSSKARASAIEDSMEQGVNSLPTPRNSSSTADPLSSGFKGLVGRHETRTPLGFRHPPKIPAMRIQTPSSSVENPEQPPAPGSSPPISTMKRRRRVTSTESDSSDDQAAPSSSDAEERAAREAAVWRRKLARKLAGVLPASYTTLAAKVPQDPNRTKTTRARSSFNAAPTAKGVARPVSSHRKSPSKGAQHLPIIFSDDITPPASPSPRTGGDAAPAEQARQMQLEEDSMNWPDIDNMEDDVIDFMPWINANRKRPRSPGSLQAKTRKRLRQSTISDQVRRNARQSAGEVRKRPKKMGILDAERKSPQSREPNFVKVAARTARARQDQGRGSPSRKVFRLHQAADNEEVQDVLRDWKDSFSDEHAGADSDADHSMPLGEISGNHGAPIEISDGDDYERQEPVQRRKPRAKTYTTRPRQRQRTGGVKGMQDALRSVATKRSIISSMKSPRTPANIPMKPGVGAPTQNVRSNAQAGPGQLSVPVLDDEPPPVLRQGNVGPSMAVDRLALLKYYEEQPAESRQAGPVGEWMFRPRKRLVRKRPPRQTVLLVGQPCDGYDSAAEHVHDDAPSELVGTNLTRSHERQPASRLEPWTPDAEVTFEIKPLPTGTLFPSPSFVGSGRFGRCIVSLGKHSQHVDTAEGENSPRTWNEKLREDITSWFKEITDLCLARPISQTSTSQPLRHLEDIATLLAQGIRFSDSVDRKSFVQHVLHLSNNTLQCLPDSCMQKEDGFASEMVLILRIQLASRLALLGHKLMEECNRGSVPYDLIGEVEKHFRLCVQDCLSQVSNIGCPLLRRFLRRYNDLSLPSCEKATSVAEAYVIIRALTTRHEPYFGDLWKALKSVGRFDDSQLPQKSQDANIARLEHHWRDMFTFLPFEDVDLRGQVSSISSTGASNWAFVKGLMKPVLQAYRVGGYDKTSMYVAYCRALLSRCFALVRQWRWHKCGLIVRFLFDFFAKNGFSNLDQESCHRSPGYLQKLSVEPELDLETGDCCFHLFLKLVGAGIRSMYNSISEKDVRSVVWRILPNHDRHFPKAQEPRIADLDATRNQHDLLCTLFWAAPPSCRPDLKYLVKLAQDDSHASVYEINIRSWLTLVSYQIHCDCTNAATSPFAYWHDELLGRLLRQHASVRAEIEDEARQAEERNGRIFSEIMKEQTIAKNQRQVESSLLDLLKSLALAVSKCPSPESASGLITAKLGRVLDLFDPKQPRLHKVLIEALKSMSLAATQGQVSAPATTSTLEDESQGLDWSGFDDLDELDLPIPEPIFVEEAYTSLHSCLSSCFAGSPAPSDDLLRRLTDTWSDVSRLYVKRGIKSWDNYLGQYGRDTWTVLADTEQKRRFAPYLWARLLDSDTTLWKSQRLLILRTWLASLTDREAQLKYQGDFTASILNLRCGDPLLNNLPLFCNSDGRFVVTLQSLQQRRLAILDTVLANMRRTIAGDTCADPATRAERKEDYKSLLEELMLAMKTRYQELGKENESQNSYVKFVHAVVKSLQEQVHDLCTLDTFFTSSAAFPLPADDPMYVASKIKAYGLRLGEPMISKRLATFLGSIIERAVHDGDVELMVRQVHTSVCMIEDRGAQSDLRSILIREFLPVYVRASISHPCAWLFTVPLLIAIGSILSDALYTLNGCNAESVAWHTSLCSAVLAVTRTALDLDNMFAAPVPVHLVKLLIATFGMVSNSLPLLTYIFELDRGTQETLEFLQDLCAACEKIQGLSHIDGLYVERTRFTGGIGRSAAGTDLQSYVKRDLDSTLARSRHDNGVYQIVRGGIWKIVSSMYDTAPMQQELLESTYHFTSALKRSSAFGYLV